MKKGLKITAFALAASLLVSGTAFADEPAAGKYSVSGQQGSITVKNTIDDTSYAVTDPTHEHVEVVEIGGRDTVIIKDVLNEAVSDKREATVIVEAGTDTDVIVGDIYHTLSGDDFLTAVSVDPGAKGDLTAGDITVVGESGAIGVFYNGEGIANVGSVYVKGQLEAFAAASYACGFDVTLNADSLKAEFVNKPASLLEGDFLSEGLTIGLYTEIDETSTLNANVKGDISGDTAGILLITEPGASANINSLGTISGGIGAIGTIGTAISAGTDLNINTWKLENSNGGDVLIAAVNVYQLTSLQNDEDACKAVNYIIKTNAGNSTIALTGEGGAELGSTGDAFETVYKTQNEDKQIIVKVTADSGYEVTGLDAGTATDGSKIIANKNADGTWTVIVPRGGGIDITPILQAIAQNESSSVIPSSWSKNWDGSRSYYKANGQAAKNEWLLINVDSTEAWYHFDENCKMNTGWMTDANDGYTYYFDPATGKMAVGTVVIDGKTCHFNENVAGPSGWKQNAAGEWVYEKQNAVPLGALIG